MIFSSKLNLFWSRTLFSSSVLCSCMGRLGKDKAIEWSNKLGCIIKKKNLVKVLWCPGVTVSSRHILIVGESQYISITVLERHHARA